MLYYSYYIWTCLYKETAAGWLSSPPVCQQAGTPAGRPAGRLDGRMAGMRAGLQTNRQACVRSCVFTVMHTHGQICLQASLKEVLSLISVLLLAAWASGERCFESQNNSVNSNPFADGFLISREISEKSARCPLSYSKAFRLLPKSGSSKVCFELLKTFRVTPKTLPPGCLSEVGQPIIKKEDIGLYPTSSLLVFWKAIYPLLVSKCHNSLAQRTNEERTTIITQSISFIGVQLKKS